jgi:hypothetical protein
MENTKKGPGRPPHNAHPTTCSGEPISQQELERKRSEAEDRKRRKQSDSKQKKDGSTSSQLDGYENGKFLKSLNSSLSEAFSNSSSSNEHGNERKPIKKSCKRGSTSTENNSTTSEVSSACSNEKENFQQQNKSALRPVQQTSATKCSYSIDSILSRVTPPTVVPCQEPTLKTTVTKRKRMDDDDEESNQNVKKKPNMSKPKNSYDENNNNQTDAEETNIESVKTSTKSQVSDEQTNATSQCVDLKSIEISNFSK